MMSVTELRKDDLNDALPVLAEILHACVASGASVGFVEPFSMRDSKTFWKERVFPEVVAGRRVLMLARDGQYLAGTVQLITAMLPNQLHRGEVSKLLVHPDFRRQGIARLLMLALMERAGKAGKSLLTLDTRTGDMAEPLYGSLGFETAGSIPNYCRSPEPNSTSLDATTYMYKIL